VQRNLFFLYLMEFCAGLARGSYLVCIAWTTLVVIGDVAAVGQVFIVAMLTTMLAGPMAAVIVDRYNRKQLTIIAHLGIALALLSLGAAVVLDSSLSLLWFFVTVAGVTFFRNLYQGSHDGLLHANVESALLITVVSRFRGIHLLATAIGTALAGVVIKNFTPGAGFVLSALASVLLVVPVAFVAGVKSKTNLAGVGRFMADFGGGLALLREYPGLRTLTLLAGVALPIGQLSNAILSSFIHDDLGRGSDVFGLVDAAWPIGGMAAAALLGLGLRRLSMANLEYLFGLLVGISTILFSYCSSVYSLAIVHAAMGFSVWICRIVIDGRILQICSSATVGRTRVYIDVTFSFAALLMCLSPTLVELPATADYFLYWGLIVVVSTLLLWLGRPKVDIVT